VPADGGTASRERSPVVEPILLELAISVIYHVGPWSGRFTSSSTRVEFGDSRKTLVRALASQNHYHIWILLLLLRAGAHGSEI